MPIPKPKPNEDKTTFIARCMGDSVMNTDYPDGKQRAAVCYAQWPKDKSEATMEIERKSFTGVELKADKPGAFTARIATLNVKDKDMDWTPNGAFPEGKEILISAYQHGSWEGALPVGKGIIHEQGNEVIVDGEFNLNSSSGKDHYETIKFAPKQTEWSYGFKVLKYGQNEELSKQGVERILEKLDVFEASPVMRGAGVNTATLSIKSDKDTTYADQSETVLAAVKDWTERTKALATLRLKESRVLSASNRDRIKNMADQLHGVHQDMCGLLDETDPNKGVSESAHKLFLEFSKLYQNYLEVI